VTGEGDGEQGKELGDRRRRQRTGEGDGGQDREQETEDRGQERQERQE